MSEHKAGERIILLDGMGNPKRPTKTTVHEFLSKPDRGVTRAELAGFVEAIVVGEVAPLIQEALRLNNVNVERNPYLRDMIAAMIVSREHDLAERKWYRRLWRKIRGTSNAYTIVNGTLSLGGDPNATKPGAAQDSGMTTLAEGPWPAGQPVVEVGSKQERQLRAEHLKQTADAQGE